MNQQNNKTETYKPLKNRKFQQNGLVSIISTVLTCMENPTEIPEMIANGSCGLVTCTILNFMQHPTNTLPIDGDVHCVSQFSVGQMHYIAVLFTLTRGVESCMIKPCIRVYSYQGQEITTTMHGDSYWEFPLESFESGSGVGGFRHLRFPGFIVLDSGSMVFITNITRQWNPVITVIRDSVINKLKEPPTSRGGSVTTPDGSEIQRQNSDFKVFQYRIFNSEGNKFFVDCFIKTTNGILLAADSKMGLIKPSDLEDKKSARIKVLELLNNGTSWNNNVDPLCSFVDQKFAGSCGTITVTKKPINTLYDEEPTLSEIISQSIGHVEQFGPGAFYATGEVYQSDRVESRVWSGHTYMKVHNRKQCSQIHMGTMGDDGFLQWNIYSIPHPRSEIPWVEVTASGRFPYSCSGGNYIIIIAFNDGQLIYFIEKNEHRERKESQSSSLNYFSNTIKTIALEAVNPEDCVVRFIKANGSNVVLAITRLGKLHSYLIH